MKLKVEQFGNIIRKSTFNFSIETTCLNITKDKIKSGMVNNYNTCISVLDVDNLSIYDMEDMEFVFNFLNPERHLMPLLQLIDTDEVTLKVHPDKIALLGGRQKSTIHFCTPQEKRFFKSEASLRSSEYFTKLPLHDGQFLGMWDKLKKIGMRFGGKVYFNSEKGNFTVETTDKTNKFANSLKFILSKLKFDDVSLCYDFNDILNLMNIIDDSFTLGFTYDENHGLGLLHANKEDDTENFFLMSKKE